MRRRGTTYLMVGLGLALVFGGAVTALAAAGGYHEDERFGFKIRTPKGWNHVAQRAEEKWIAAKFLCDRTYIYNSPDDGWTWDFRPDMTIVTFIDEVVTKKAIEAGETDDGELWIELNNPYKNYEDFLKRTYSGGGWFVDEEEEDKLGDIPVTKYVIKVEKLTNTGPKRIITWVYHVEDVDIAVQFELLEGSYDKLKNDVHACLKSFKEIPRTSGSLVPVTTGNRITTSTKSEDAMTPEERTKARQESERLLHQKAKDALPDDWTAKQMGRFLVLNHADAKFAKKMVANAECIWKWMDKNLGYIGEGEYVRRPILRICRDQPEESAFRGGTTWGNSIEIVTHQDKGSGAMSWEFEYVNQQIFRKWFNHRNRDLYYAMPYWLEDGLWQVLGTARAKGSRLEFKIDDWERDGLRESARAGEITPPRELVMLRKDQFYENEHRMKQSSAFIRFLLESRKGKRILDDYLKNLQDVVAEQKAKDDAKDTSDPDKPKTEEEEEEMYRKRREAMKEREQQFMEEVFERTFGDWSEKDWKRFNSLFLKYVS